MNTEQTQKYTLSAPGYDKLADVLLRAFKQASEGKGKDRHASEGLPFERQPMSTINIEQGSIDGFLYQARKKALEAKRLPTGRAQAELLGAINYLAGAVIALDTWAAGTLPDAPKKTSQPECDPASLAFEGGARLSFDADWTPWDGGGMDPVGPSVVVECQHRGITNRMGHAATFNWSHRGTPGDILAYRVVST